MELDTKVSGLTIWHTAVAFSTIPMATSSTVSGSKTKHRASANTLPCKVSSMKGIGLIISQVVRASRPGKMARYIKEHSVRDRSLERDTTDGLMVANTTVNGIKINLRDGVDTYGLTESSSMAPSPITK